jgi:hypothetical protein
VDTVVPQYKIFLAWNFEVIYVRYLGRFNIICLAGLNGSGMLQRNRPL